MATRQGRLHKKCEVVWDRRGNLPAQKGAQGGDGGDAEKREPATEPEPSRDDRDERQDEEHAAWRQRNGQEPECRR